MDNESFTIVLFLCPFISGFFSVGAFCEHKDHFNR